MTPRGERAVWVGLGVLLVAAIVVALASLKREEREVEIGFQGEARENPFLAAQRFLGVMGVPVQRAASLAVLPPPDHALLLAFPGHVLDAPRSERMLDWVRAGGHVVAPATGPGASWSELAGDPLLSACGVAGVPSDPKHAGSGDGSIPAFALREERPLDVVGERRPLRVLVRTDVGLLSDGTGREGGRQPVADASSHPSIATCAVGEGRVTVVNELFFATNGEIGERDHARLLWRLATLDRVPAGLWLVRRDSGSSLGQIVLDRGLPLVIALVLLGAAAALRAGVRFGPPLPLPPRGRRSLLEHVEAVGALLWRAKRQDVLLSATRLAFTARAAARRPELARLPAAERIAALAAGSGLPAESLREALEEPAIHDPDAFVRHVRTLQTARRSL